MWVPRCWSSPRFACICPPGGSEARDDLRGLIEHGPAAQKAVKRKAGVADGALDEAVYEATLKEVNEIKVLVGPVSEAHLFEKFGPRWVPARRIGLRQGGKVRHIDVFQNTGTMQLSRQRSRWTWAASTRLWPLRGPWRCTLVVAVDDLGCWRIGAVCTCQMGGVAQGACWQLP